MARKDAKEAAKKKAAKQKKLLIFLVLVLVGALGFAAMTLMKGHSAPAAATTPPADTTSAGSDPATGTPVSSATPVSAGIDPPPAGSLRSFSAFDRKDPFYDDGPNLSSSSSTPDGSVIADQSTSGTSSSTSSHTSSGDRGVKAAVLKPSQVGSGYEMKVGAASNCVAGCTTLDICGYDYKSEADRTARLQVNYVKSENDPVLSNEVVRYRSGGAALAMRELNQAVRTCPKTAVSQGDGTSLTWRVHRFTAPHLLSGAVALRITATGTEKKNGVKVAVSISGVAIYQVRGNLLSGVYEFLGENQSVATNFTVHAAQASALNLIKAAH